MFEFSSNVELIIYIVEVFGVISFATSGAFVAIRKNADILGVLILTLIAIFGGGLLRDIILHQGVPHILWDASYLFLALIGVIVAVIWFILAYHKKTAGFIDSHRHDAWIYYLDAFGIAVFCVAGVNVAETAIPEGVGIIGVYVFLTIIGVITGVGGGMFRDVFVGEIPSVFKKHFYMTPCIIGSLVYALMEHNQINVLLSTGISVTVIVLLRILAIKFLWNLPTAKGYKELHEQKEEK